MERRTPDRGGYTAPAFILLILLLFLVNIIQLFSLDKNYIYTIFKKYRYALISITLILFLAFIIIRKRYIKNTICMDIYSSIYMDFEELVGESVRLGNLFRGLSRKGVVEYTIENGKGKAVIRSRVEGYIIGRLLSLFRNIIINIVDNEGPCIYSGLRDTFIYNVVFFNNISKLIIKYKNSCKYILVILFKYYNISDSLDVNVINLSNIINIEQKLIILENRLIRLLGDNGLYGKNSCMILVDPIEYIMNNIDICNRIKRMLSDAGIRPDMRCILALNEIERKHIKSSLLSE